MRNGLKQSLNNTPLSYPPVIKLADPSISCVPYLSLSNFSVPLTKNVKSAHLNASLPPTHPYPNFIPFIPFGFCDLKPPPTLKLWPPVSYLISTCLLVTLPSHCRDHLSVILILCWLWTSQALFDYLVFTISFVLKPLKCKQLARLCLHDDSLLSFSLSSPSSLYLSRSLSLSPFI